MDVRCRETLGMLDVVGDCGLGRETSAVELVAICEVLEGSALRKRESWGGEKHVEVFVQQRHREGVVSGVLGVAY